ncbi:MAG TPA: HD domain-containing protein [Acidimicrobiia bacterium]|nr:HD domain-containing protein [Acidimicrobiia bacterium]
MAAEVALGPLYAHALEFALMAHAGQVRKGTTTPYFAHVIGVSALVLENGGSEKEAIAALLHDIVEDSENGEAVAKLIRKQFGKKVRNIVLMCSDTTVQPKPPWLERKRNYLAHVRSEAHLGERTGFLRVTAADKLYNVRSILADRDEVGDGVFERFSADRERTIAYYVGLRDALSLYRGDDLGIARLIHQFSSEVNRLGMVDPYTLDELCA